MNEWNPLYGKIDTKTLTVSTVRHDNGRQNSPFLLENGGKTSASSSSKKTSKSSEVSKPSPTVNEQVLPSQKHVGEFPAE